MVDVCRPAKKSKSAVVPAFFPDVFMLAVKARVCRITDATVMIQVKESKAVIYY
jgi:hypothetical protein